MTQKTAKSNSVVTTEWSGDILSINVLGAGSAGSDGQPMDAAIMFDRTRASEANREAAERHGWTQRLCDAAAKARNKATGRPASAAEKFASIQELADYYEQGEVSWKRAGGGSEGGLLLDALCEYKPEKTRDEWLGWLKGQSEAFKRTLANSTKVKPIIDRMRAERTGTVDTDDLLGDFESEVSVDDEIASLMPQEADSAE